MSSDQNGGEARGVWGMIVWILYAHAFFPAAWLRKPGSCGSRAWGLEGVVALFWLPFFGLMLDQKESYHTLLYFIAASMCWCAVHNVTRVVAESRGHWRHSAFMGYSIFKGKPSRVYGVYEPLTCIAVGTLFCFVGAQCLGVYLITSAFALGFVYAMIQMRDNARVRQMRDKQAEQRYLQELMKEQGGD